GDEGGGCRGRGGEEVEIVGDLGAARIDADLDVLQRPDVELVEDRSALVVVRRLLALADELVERVDVVQRIAAAAGVGRGEDAAPGPSAEIDRRLVVEL